MDKVKFAVIGVGGFGLKRVNSILRSEVAELTYIVDANEDITKNLSKRVGGEAISFDELLLRKDYDVAIVAVPNALHEELTIRLLKSKKDVWCEKPMAVSINSARRMLVNSVESRSILKIGSNPRYFPNVLRAIELIRQDYIGKPLFFRGWIGNEGLHLQSKTWYTKKEVVGGGTLIDNGVHLIDMIRYLVDEIAKCNFCILGSLKHSIKDLEDNAIAVYELIHGGLAHFHSSWTERSGYMYFEVHGDKGYIHVDSRWSKATIKYGRSSDEPACEDYTHHPKISYDLELEDFVRDYREGFHPKPTSYDGYRAIKVIMKSYLAASKCFSMLTFDDSDRKLEKAFLKCFNVRDSYIRP